MSDEAIQKLDDPPELLTTHTCWYVTLKPDRPYATYSIEGKYRNTPLALAESFSREPLDCESVEFSDKYTNVKLYWYPAEKRWTWDFPIESSYGEHLGQENGEWHGSGAQSFRAA